jgi:hypothetical protein
MPVDQALRDLMTDSITIEPPSSRNVNVEKSYGAAVTYTCRVVGKRRIVRKANGQEAVSNATVYLDRLASIHPDSRITLPARFTPSQPPILEVGSLPDEDGTTGSGAHTVIYV